MNSKQARKIRQLVRRNQSVLCSQSWDVFFETMANLKLKYRIKMAWEIIIGKNIRKEEKNKNGNT